MENLEKSYNCDVSRSDVRSPLIWNVKRWSQEQVDFAIGLAQKHGYRTAIEEREGRRDLIISGHDGDLSGFWRELDHRYPPTIYEPGKSGTLALLRQHWRDLGKECPQI